MSGQVLGQVPCSSCDSPVDVREGKGTVLTGYCGGCGTQIIVKRARGIACLRSKLSGKKPLNLPSHMIPQQKALHR